MTQNNSTPLHRLVAGPLVAVLALGGIFTTATAAVAAGVVVPPDSGMARAGPGTRSVLLSALELDAAVQPGGWHFDGASVTPSPAAVAPKAGAVALRLAGTARAAGSKGDFGVGAVGPGAYRRLGLWVHLDAASNASRVGVQVSDGEGETLLATVPADWTGWRWVEFDLAGDAMRPAYEQKDKNGRADAPINGVRVAWFAKGPGPSAIDVDALVATIEAPAADAAGRDTAPLSGGTSVEPAAGAQLVLTNPADEPRQATIEFSLQQDPALYFEVRPRRGTRHRPPAREAGPSPAGGGSTRTRSPTARSGRTRAPTGKDDFHAEAVQFVDLGGSGR